MDVTSLLNSSSAAVEQKRAESSRQPTRNRTPWDAGGYSLPINTLSTSNPSTPPRQIHCDDSRFEDATSPKHKFSDSRSSLSSFTSSLQSTTHSRFSSMSTVNSSHPMNNLGAESLSPQLKALPQSLDLAASLPMSTDSGFQSSGESRARASLSPTGSLEALAAVAEHQSACQEPEKSSSTTPMETAMNNTPPESVSHGRPSSPSDAILIKRTTVPALRVSTGELELNGAEQSKSSRHYLSAPLENHHQSLVHSTRHKRAVSAPDFSGVGEIAMSNPPSMGPRGEPTPPSSLHPDHASPMSLLQYPAPDTPPATATEAESKDVVCMYIPNCDTGSQLRKAISHIFGRNKMCTRLIPQEVWVHYCRKHYQRSRYRNPKEYAKLQCDLVQQQIRRVHEWSLNNMKNGVPGTVQDWGLAVRKREQKRLDDIGGANRKRRATTFDQNDSDEDENANDAGSRGNPVPATAVPAWLLALCGKGYSTHAILEIFNRLHTEILEDLMSCFPDIEILPNIVVDQEEPKSPKGYTKRNLVSAGHKRSQSLGVGMKPDYFSPNRRLSQTSAWGQEEATYGSPAQKRRRPNDVSDSPDRILPPFQRPRLAERPIETGRRIQHLAHRPVFANIDEHHVANDEYRESQMRDNYYAHSPASYHPPLPAPTPQRLGSQSMAAHLETNNEHVARRPMHQRSMSDMGGFGRGRSLYSPTPSNVYSSDTNYQPRPNQFQGQGQPNGYYAPPPPRYREESAPPALPYADLRPMKHLPGPGHSRHQSTPMIQPAFSAESMPFSRGSQPPSAYPYPQHQNTLPPVPHISETQQARDLYNDRR